MTLATDYALGLLAVSLSIRMRHRGAASGRSYWVAALAAAGAAALLGGTYHGFLPWLDTRIATVLWKATLLSIGCAAYGVSMATIRIHLSAPARRVCRIVAAVQLALYSLGAMLTDAFLIAIVNYAIAFGFVLAVHARAWLRWRDRPAAWVIAGVVVSFLAAGIQAAGIAPHPHFNHNDLYHVVQMVGTWMLYRGASRQSDMQPE